MPGMGVLPGKGVMLRKGVMPCEGVMKDEPYGSLSELLRDRPEPGQFAWKTASQQR